MEDLKFDLGEGDVTDVSTKLQRVLFKLGYAWPTSATSIQFTNYRYIYTETDSSIYFGYTEECFKEDRSAEPDVATFIKLHTQHDTGGERKNTGKPQLSYCMLGKEVLEGEANAWSVNDKKNGGKYDTGNWLRGMSWSESVDSLDRHMVAFINGEDLDSESGLPHVDYIVCCAKIVSNAYHTRKDLDDRVKLVEKE